MTYNLAYLASGADNQNVTLNNLAQNLTQSYSILLQCSTLMQVATIRRQPLHVLNVNKWDLSKILSKILASKALIVRMESKISKIFES